MDPWLEFLAREERARIDNERVQDFPDTGSGSGPALAPLTDRGVLRVRGADADKLLQGQLTCDVLALAPGATSPGALCDTKGRMFSSFLVHRCGDEEILLVMHRGLVDTTRQTLGKYAPFYKVELEDASDQWRALGIRSPDPCDLVAGRGEDEDHHCLRFDDDRALVLVPTAQSEALWTALRADLAPLGEPDWERLEIAAGRGEVRPETTGIFIPQMLNLQQTGGVSFRKGCYTGQEIVARMHYLGKLKRRMYRLVLATEGAPVPGTDIENESGKEVGTVVMAAAGGGETQMLAVLTAQAAEAPRLRFGDGERTFRILPMPYEDEFAAPEQP